LPLRPRKVPGRPPWASWVRLLQPSGSRKPPATPDAEEEAGVADPVHDEGLELGVGRAEPVLEHTARADALEALVVGIVADRRLGEPEADQQVAAQADQLPADERHEQVVAQHDGEHGEDEEAELPREARRQLVSMHVPGVVDQHDGGEQADDHGHDRAHRVGVGAEAEGEAAEVEPRHVRALVGRAMRNDEDGEPHGERGAAGHDRGAERMREVGPRHQHGEQRGGQRSQQDSGGQPGRDHERSSRVFSRSMSLVVR